MEGRRVLGEIDVVGGVDGERSGVLSGSEQAFVFFGGAEGLEEGCTLVLKRLEGPHSILEEGENIDFVGSLIAAKTVDLLVVVVVVVPRLSS